MNPVVMVQLIKGGFELANGVVSVVGEHLRAQQRTAEAAARAQVAQAAATVTLQHHLSNSINQVADDLTQRIQEVGRAIVDKIESDRLEELRSRISNATLLLKMEKAGDSMSYMMSLKESADYARNRVREDKLHWIGPWLSAEALFAAGLATDPSMTSSQLDALSRAIQEARFKILDLTVPHAIRQGKAVPWSDVAAFLGGGEMTALLKLLPQVASQETSGSGQPSSPGQTTPFEANPLRAEQVPGGRKVCISCQRVSFDRTTACPSCMFKGSGGRWWQ